MPLDPNIYQQMQPNLASQLAGSLNQFTEQRARLSDLARQQQMQDVTFGQQQEQYGQQQVAAKASAQQKAQQQGSLEVANILRSGMPIDQAEPLISAVYDKYKIPKDNLSQKLSGIYAQQPEQSANLLEEQAYPAEAAKQRMEQRFAVPKPETLSNVGRLRSERARLVAANPNDPAIKIYDQAIQKETTHTPFMQVATGEGGAQSLITAPKLGGAPTVTPLGITKPTKGGKAGTLEGENQMPIGAVKEQNEAVENLFLSSSINADLGTVKSQLEKGGLDLSPTGNLESEARLKLGVSDPKTVKYATFKNTINKLRNDSLRLNKGTQTEGDAQRVLDELFSNLGDKEYVKQRVAELMEINKRAAEFHENKINLIRENYGNKPLDVSKYKNVKSALGAETPAGEHPADIAAILAKQKQKPR